MDAMSSPHVLLTGANGFIASHILAYLIKVRHLTSLLAVHREIEKCVRHTR